MSDTTEQWKDVEGYEGLYQISNLGRVKSLSRTTIRRNGSPSPVKEKILSPSFKADYKVLNLCKNGKKVLTRVHILIAKAFIDNPDNQPLVCHKNDIKYDNRLENLYWGNHSTNGFDANNNGIGTRGSANGMAVLNASQVREIRELLETDTVSNISRKFGVSRGAINDIRNRRNWKHI
jgi:hypothetical protein